MLINITLLCYWNKSFLQSRKPSFFAWANIIKYSGAVATAPYTMHYL